MIVHSFSTKDTRYTDFEQFVRLLGGEPRKDHLVAIPNRSGPTLHLGWVRGDPKFLKA